MHHRYFFVSLIFCCCSLLFSQPSQDEFRATWVITWEHIAPDDTPEAGKARIRAILDNHKDGNFNAVLFQVRQSGTAYYNSSFEPWGYYAGGDDPGYDPLAYVIEQAHQRGIEVHAWFNVFAAASTVAGTPAAEHPEWVCRDRDGNAMTEHRALSPGLEAVREYTRDVALEIVNNYDIDGFHLDYIRWNEYSNTMRSGATELEQIRAMDGIISDQQIHELSTNRTGRYLYDVEHLYSSGVPDGFSSWEEWWRWSVTETVRMLHDSIQAVKPYVRLSAAVLGRYNWGGWQGYGTVYQDAALWFNEGYADQLTPMHYHWTTANDFYNILSGGCPDCWETYIQPGIAEGRLYTVGPGSYILHDNNVWNRHGNIVETVRTVPWTDGFQFFSYGTWDFHDYWEEAGNTFFSKKTKIREVSHPTSVTPEAPSISIIKNDSLNYTITITPPDTLSYTWFVLYRSENDTFNIDEDKIIDIRFGHTEYETEDTFTGLQDYNAEYIYGATRANRFWKESQASNTVMTDSIPSFAPTITSSTPPPGGVFPIRSDIEIEFSKNMDTSRVHDAISVDPVYPYDMNWTTPTTNLSLHFLSDLPYNTEFVLTIDSSAADVNGVLLDANGDGIPGDSFVLSFMTEAEDVYGPLVFDSNVDISGLTVNVDVEDVITIVFDEYLDVATIDATSIGLYETMSTSGPAVDFNFVHNQIDDHSYLTIKPVYPFEPDLTHRYVITSDVTDTVGNPFAGIEAFLRTEAKQYNEITLIDGFGSVSNWWQPDGSGSTTGILAGTSWGTNNDVYIPGTANPRSAKLHYVWDTADSTHLLREYLSGGPPKAVEFDTSYTLQCYVFGDGSHNLLRFCLDENLPQTAAEYHEVSRWDTIDWYGWKLVEWDLGDTSTVGSWLGNEILEGTLRIDSIHLTHIANAAQDGTIYFDNLRVIKKTTELTTEPEPPVATSFRLEQNYPNPFNSATTIRFSIPVKDRVALSIYDIRGHRVKTLTDKTYNPGEYSIIWNGLDARGKPVASGMYFYRLEGQQTAITRQLVYLK